MAWDETAWSLEENLSVAAVWPGWPAATAANGQRALGPAWLVTNRSLNWAQVVF